VQCVRWLKLKIKHEGYDMSRMEERFASGVNGITRRVSNIAAYTDHLELEILHARAKSYTTRVNWHYEYN